MDNLNNKVSILQEEIAQLKRELIQKEECLSNLLLSEEIPNPYTTKLSVDEIVRYSRQMLVPNIGVNGQLLLKESKVLIVGAGGLGCPSALYLIAAGIGEITLIDSDEVELTNLHRQILYSESDVGKSKVQSAYERLLRLNSGVKIIPLKVHANGSSLNKLMKEHEYNVVIDGSDNVPTRYMINDACIFNKVPLVSGSALKMEGQLTVYNYKNGPCYRCIFPVPPPTFTVTSCGDGGVLGIVPGVIGILQALETIKIIIDAPEVLSGSLLLFNAEEIKFRNVHLRSRNTNCVVCGDRPTVTKPVDYEMFCSARAHDKVTDVNILTENFHINVKELANILKEDPLIIDVRPEAEFQMCHLPNTFNIPFNAIARSELDILKDQIETKGIDDGKVYVICRRGNDSQRAVEKLKEHFDSNVHFVSVQGGLHAYARCIDSRFPIY